MAVVFKRGQELGRSDLDIFLRDEDNRPADAFRVRYAIYDYTTGVEVLIGDPEREPAHPDVGEYYAAFTVSTTANIGTYRIRWAVKQFVSSADVEIVQEFDVVEANVVTSELPYPEKRAALMRRLRIILRDQNPEKFYHFRPPTSETSINQFGAVFGQIWEDEELSEYLDMAVDTINLHPPNTDGLYPTLDLMIMTRPSWRSLLTQASIITAARALQFNWVAEEFSYSIGGINLDLERSSKYQGLASDAQQQFDSMIEKAKKVEKYTLGLQQPRFNGGFRGSSRLGPEVRPGLSHPRNWIGGF